MCKLQRLGPTHSFVVHFKHREQLQLQLRVEQPAACILFLAQVLASRHCRMTDDILDRLLILFMRSVRK